VAKLLFLLLLVVSGAAAQAQGSVSIPNQGAVLHFIHGNWFDGTHFEPADFYAEGGYLTQHPDERRAYQTVDLQGGFIVPPYGDAHEHNFDNVDITPRVTAAYLRDGIFYAQGMTDVAGGANTVKAAGMVDTPQTVEVTYAHGGLTGVNGHPKEVYESLANGFYYPQTDAQRKLVIEGSKQEGQAYWQIATLADLNAKWPAILAAKPDLIKVYLLTSEHFKPATASDPQLAKGIDPALVAPIVKLAHACGLKVAAHIDTAYDFHVAVVAGVDEMGHLPGYGLGATEDPSVYRLAEADIALAARQHVAVQPTAELAAEGQPPAELLARRRALQIDNLRRLKAAGIRILVGSDRYGSDSRKEADYLDSLGLWTNLEMLRMWAVETPETIFPGRRIGALKPGYEASFLVLKANPLVDWSATHQIADRWKQGEHLDRPSANAAAN
jgi:hypothetical protein